MEIEKAGYRIAISAIRQRLTHQLPLDELLDDDVRPFAVDQREIEFRAIDKGDSPKVLRKKRREQSVE